MNYSGVIIVLSVFILSTAEFRPGAYAAVGDAGVIDVALEPMINLNFKSKKEILMLRKKYVLKHPELLNGVYKPSEAVFGQIVDFKSWWGIKGYHFYGPGPRSIEGPSEQSKFVANPFLLVGLNDLYVHRANIAQLKPEAIYLIPKKLLWSADKSSGTVTYDISGFIREALEYEYDHIGELQLVTYNAIDMGFRFCRIDTEKSVNITMQKQAPGGIIQLKQYIHCGGSSGYPGGSNNVSPYEPELMLNFSRMPAKVYIELWKEMPSGQHQKADMVFIIDMK